MMATAVLGWSRCRRKSTRPATGTEQKSLIEACIYRRRGDPPSWRVTPPSIFMTVCYMLLGGSSCFSVGVGVGCLNAAVVLFCFCLFYFKLCLCVEL